MKTKPPAPSNASNDARVKRLKVILNGAAARCGVSAMGVRHATHGLQPAALAPTLCRDTTRLIERRVLDALLQELEAGVRDGDRAEMSICRMVALGEELSYRWPKTDDERLEVRQFIAALEWGNHVHTEDFVVE